jgi:S-adenosylmethionine decarboxylase
MMKQPANGVSYLENFVDAYSCDPTALRSREALEQVFARLIEDLNLKPAAEPVWHVFPSPGGITGLCLLTESHITIHTFPETGLATINLYCCRPRPVWSWEIHLAAILGAGQVDVRTIARGERLLGRQLVSRPLRRSDNRDVAARKSGGPARQTATRERP